MECVDREVALCCRVGKRWISIIEISLDVRDVVISRRRCCWIVLMVVHLLLLL